VSSPWRRALRVVALALPIAVLALSGCKKEAEVQQQDQSGRATKQPDFSGAYVLREARSPDGKAYTGSATLKKGGAFYTLDYAPDGAEPYKGLARQEGNFFGGVSAPGGEASLAIYDMHARGMTGEIATTASDKVGREELDGAEALGGVYTITKGVRPDGSTYKGVIEVTAAGPDLYTFEWKLEGGVTQSGLGIMRGGVVVVGFAKGAAPRVALYDIVDGSLKGVTRAPGVAELGAEILGRL
jgi:hypothetical protein